VEYTYLGRTGIQVSRYALGTGMFGSLGNPDHDECVRMVQTALDAGINFIDTADVYSDGESESIVGKAIAGRRDDVVLSTKYFAPMAASGEVRNRWGASRRWIVQEVENSLTRLNTDYIDIYLQHHFDSNTAIEETLSALSDLVHQGKVRSIGSSNFAAERIVEAQWQSEMHSYERFRIEEAPYSLFRRGIERAILPTCRRYGIGVMAWSPLDGSWLTGRYRQQSDFADSHRFHHVRTRRGGSFEPDSPEHLRKLELVGQLDVLAQKADMPLTHLATAFTLAHPDVNTVLLGPRTTAQLDDSLASVERRLEPELLDALDALIPPGTDIASAESGSTVPLELGRRYRRRGI